MEYAWKRHKSHCLGYGLLAGLLALVSIWFSIAHVPLLTLSVGLTVLFGLMSSGHGLLGEYFRFRDSDAKS